MDALGDMEARAFREIDSCRYIIVDKEGVQELIRNPNLSEEAQQALKKVLEEVDFEKEIFTVYPWW
ncbi:Con-6 family protein [Acetobacterium malicum]|uniref:Con-6 family protein n=1 Tax=Acetobacterium malicum TaxID=52692 RepID=UPI003592EB4E